MNYSYKCMPCDHPFDVIKSMHDAARPEPCPKCNETAKRIYVPPFINKVSSQVFMPQYVPSLGKSFNSKREMQYYAEKHNMVEVGNDFGSGEKMQKEFDDSRARRDSERWEKYDEHEKLAAIIKDGGNLDKV